MRSEAWPRCLLRQQQRTMIAVISPAFSSPLTPLRTALVPCTRRCMWGDKPANGQSEVIEVLFLEKVDSTRPMLDVCVAHLALGRDHERDVPPLDVHLLDALHGLTT